LNLFLVCFVFGAKNKKLAFFGRISIHQKILVSRPLPKKGYFQKKGRNTCHLFSLFFFSTNFLLFLDFFSSFFSALHLQ